MSIGKTALMRSTEQKYLGGQRLETALGPLVTQMGLRGAADHLDVSSSTLNYWMLKYRIQTKRIAVGPDAQIFLNGKVLVRGDGEP